VGRNSNRYCLGYSLRAGLVFTKTPDHCVPNFGHKKPQRARLRLARLKESLRSAGDFTSARRRSNRKRFGIRRGSSSHNKPLVPTRNGEAPLLAAQRRRWASSMRFLALPFIFCIALPGLASGDSTSEFEAARETWRSAGLRSYSFIYELGGGVVIAPRCAAAKIRVVVRNGVSAPPIVAQGSVRCPRGTRGEKAIGFAVPATIDAAFAEMRRYIHEPPTPVRIAATYDPAFGIPLTYYAEKLELLDNDEGFRISSFKVLK
jgi:hypothetical protein